MDAVTMPARAKPFSAIYAVAAYTCRSSVAGLSLALLLAAGLLACHSALAESGPSEYELKAAFLYQFISYVEWPEAKTAADSPLLVGVVGAPELANTLLQLAMNPNNPRAIEVRSLPPDGDPHGLHVLFVAGNFEQQAQNMLRTAAENAVLTITEAVPRSHYGIINFEVIDSKVRFDIALQLARQHGLDISARLLKVALRVVDQP